MREHAISARAIVQGQLAGMVRKGRPPACSSVLGRDGEAHPRSLPCASPAVRRSAADGRYVERRRSASPDLSFVAASADIPPFRPDTACAPLVSDVVSVGRTFSACPPSVNGFWRLRLYQPCTPSSRRLDSPGSP